jgi:hypothetical protein
MRQIALHSAGAQKQKAKSKKQKVSFHDDDYKLKNKK